MTELAVDNEGVDYKLANCELMRLDVDTEHYYYGAKKAEDTKLYFMSVTHVIDTGGPFPEGLRQYLRVTNYEEQKEHLRMTGDRGKKLHNALDELMQRKDLDMKQYPTNYEKDAIITFIRMMRFLAPNKYHTELIVADPDLRVAGTLDFQGFVDAWKIACLLDPNRFLDVDSDGDLMLKERHIDMPKNKKRVNIIIDWKFTGRNAYSHKVQVSGYKTMYNKSYNGRTVSRAFTWRYSPKHKYGFDFSESMLDYKSFKRIYQTALEFFGEYPEPPTLRRYPTEVRLYEPIKKESPHVQ